MDLKHVKRIFIIGSIITCILILIIIFAYSKENEDYNKFLQSFTGDETSIPEETKKINLNGGVNVTEDMPEYDLMDEKEQTQTRINAYSEYLYCDFETSACNFMLDKSFDEYVLSISPTSGSDSEYVTSLYKGIKTLASQLDCSPDDIRYVECGYDENAHNSYLIIKATEEYKLFLETTGIYYKKTGESVDEK